MAIDGNFYSPNEFRLAVKAETALGTANTATMQLVNHDGIFSPMVGGVELHEVRSGVGRTEKAADHYINTKGAEKEFTVSGIADKTVLPMLLANVMTTTVGVSPASYDVPFNYSPPALTHGAVFADNTGTLTFAWISPESGRTKIYAGCVVSKLTIKGSHQDDGGRLHFDATIRTGYKISDNQATPSSMSAYPSTYYFLYDMNATRTVGGNDVILNSIDLTLDNPAAYRGSQGANGDPEIISRGVPGLRASAALGVVYDANTSALFSSHETGSTMAVEFSNNAAWSSATGFGFKADYGVLNLPKTAQEDAGMSLNIPLAFKASTSGDMLQVIA
ncbi:MAG: hypothetical protein IIA59_12095 [Candidatus Marinimicrobia bacterium]|nr:hypothetical protein [Candidatus Neomarinimicrobiota bacterium]